MPSSSSPVRRRLALGLSGLMLAAGLAGSWLFYSGLKNSEAQALNRHVEYLASYVRSDILATVNEQVQAQQRKAQRLARTGLIDQAGWRADARLFKVHYPYYRSIAVLDPDLRIHWLEGTEWEPVTEGDRYPVGEVYRDVLTESAVTGMLVIARPRLLPDGKAGVTFINPIGTGDQHLGFLASVLSVPDAVDAMVSDMFRDELVLRVTARDSTIYPFPSLDDASRFDWSSSFAIDLDGDGDGFLFELGISDLGRRQLGTMLPVVALAGGIAGSFLIAIIAYLGLNASDQTRVLRKANQRLEEEIRERQQAERELEFLVSHDPLTGLPNRTGSTRYLERALSEQDDKEGQFAVLFLDLDQFKDINDSLGHQLGDRLLCEIPPRLAAVLKDRDFVGRHGGDEFLIAARRADREQIEQLAVTILRSLDPGFAIDDNRFFISASIGIAFYPESGRSVSELIQNADAALFKAKNAGRNQFAVFTREMFSQAQHRLNLSRDIRHALDAGQFRLVYQPIVSVRDLSLCGLEALLRWEHEKGYMVPPQDFIRVAEETGIIGRLGEFAMEQALSDLAHWKSLTERPPWLAVNISGAQIREGGFAEQLSVLLHEYRIEPELLHLEITEEILIENLMRNRRMLQKLDDIGMRVVVDDFGVGYSSLAYLKNFPISVVKIDRGFVKDLATDSEDQAITRTICSLASDLGMLTVAEGVETREQLDLLRQFRCSFAQGYLFSRPVDATAVVAMLDQQPAWSRLISA
jgi:diguanylate cyclase (GGDEF)-like protein